MFERLLGKEYPEVQATRKEYAKQIIQLVGSEHIQEFFGEKPADEVWNILQANPFKKRNRRRKLGSVIDRTVVLGQGVQPGVPEETAMMDQFRMKILLLKVVDHFGNGDLEVNEDSLAKCLGQEIVRDVVEVLRKAERVSDITAEQRERILRPHLAIYGRSREESAAAYARFQGKLDLPTHRVVHTGLAGKLNDLKKLRGRLGP